ncbi:DinB family protein [Streptomyces sp. NPDC060194]|uniref:DinB family protein n=1 Tax=Streptomyces sp. NPDC060194 TaxID=3347069 RepID=UPI0036583293
MTIFERPDPSLPVDERTMLDSWLDHHRATLAAKCSGLDDEQLRRAAVAPSGLTLLGLLRHLAEVERWWYAIVLAGEPDVSVWLTDDDQDRDFHVTEHDTGAEAFAVWETEVARSREIAARYSLDDVSVGTRQTGEHVTFRWIHTHMLEEYARHNGHADLLREAVDGARG